ncbi:hypothetical protein AOZ06_36145 [Kibdelosporangium phytohabitans]|uniref:Uncharacterized protein n=1 Tax=Kibdelosporangium phytohabitans TaxID=860235 RepID=A0A0N7F4J2_9PSEU|nr:hypothetical protein AOZ06_36145 [Kibdelosporangium phytohabitans]
MPALRRAHDVGHAVLALHLAAHHGLLFTAWQQRRFACVISQLALAGAAALFDRDRHQKQPGWPVVIV